jgi:hypothetical protein
MPAEVIALLEQRHIQAGPGQLPRARQTGDAGTNDCYFHDFPPKKCFVQDKCNTLAMIRQMLNPVNQARSPVLRLPILVLPILVLPILIRKQCIDWIQSRALFIGAANATAIRKERM